MDKKFEDFSVNFDGAAVLEKPIESSSGPIGKPPNENQASTKSRQGDNIQYPATESLEEDKIIMLIKIDRTFDNTTSLAENGSKIEERDIKEIVLCHEIKNDTAEESPSFTVFRQQIEKVASFGDQSFESLKVRKETVTASHAFRPFHSEKEPTPPDVPLGKDSVINEISDFSSNGETKRQEEEIGKQTSEVQFEETKKEDIQIVNEGATEGDVEVTGLPTQKAFQNMGQLENVLSLGESDAREIDVDSHEEFVKVQVQVIVENDNTIQGSPMIEQKVSKFDTLNLSIGNAEEELDPLILGNPELRVESTQIFPTDVEELVRVQTTEVIVEVTDIILPVEAIQSRFEDLNDSSDGEYESAEVTVDADSNNMLDLEELQAESVIPEITELEEFVTVKTTEVIVDITDKNLTEKSSSSITNQSKIDEIIKKLGLEKATRKHKPVTH